MAQEPNSLQLHLDKPSSARIYDYILDHDSPHNYAIDREFADRAIQLMPDIQPAMRENRRFIGRAVEYAVKQGIRQFIDIGSGLPNKGQPHEIADRLAPNAGVRVVYVDNELIANAHSNMLLTEQADPERHKAVLADFFNHGDLLRKVEGTGLIDFEQPVCLLITAILHFMSPKDGPEIPLTVYRNELAPGSMLVLTHGGEDPDYEGLQAVIRAYAKTTNPAYLRTDEEIRPFFGDWKFVKPGLTWSGLWHPRKDRSVEPWWVADNRHEEPWWGDTPARMLYRAGVAIKGTGE